MIAALLCGATITGAIALLSEGAQRATLEVLFQKFLQPLGTTLLFALYFWRDFFTEHPESKSKAESSSQATAQVTAAPEINIHNYIDMPLTPPSSPFDNEEIGRIIDPAIREKNECKAETVTARNLIITDREGKPRIFLTTSDKGRPFFAMLGDENQLRAVLSEVEFANTITPYLDFFDAEGTIKLHLGLHRDSPILNFFGTNSRNACSLTDGPRGPVLALFDKADEIRTLLHTGALAFYDEKGVLTLAHRTINERIGG